LVVGLARAGSLKKAHGNAHKSENINGRKNREPRAILVAQHRARMRASLRAVHPAQGPLHPDRARDRFTCYAVSDEGEAA
jgi:hypothetical protein